ncbi:hypothetical protein [Stenotrophomonas maltophilia]|uniref:hypothetical protein n=1 Tax=Stenotrophomonas maltophilia TaxID=40324 RepID=UPI001FA74E9B|nr:hypothetical protein [Stenotrophomonas maltophilia]
MHPTLRALLGAILLPACSAAAATSTLDISGTITVKAAPCEISIADQDKLAFGQIAYENLKPSEMTELAAVTLPATLTCPNGARRVQMSFVDNMDPITMRASFTIKDRTDTSKLAGVYIVRLMDGVNQGRLSGIWRFDGKNDAHLSDQAWANTPGSGMGFLQAVENASFNINVKPRLLSQAAFSPADEIDLIGSFTINLIYI